MIIFSKFFIYKNVKIKNLIQFNSKNSQIETLLLFKNYFLLKQDSKEAFDKNIDINLFENYYNDDRKLLYQKIKKTLIKSKKDIFIIPGRVFILKQQSTYMGIIHLFKPTKKKKKIKKIFNFTSLFKKLNIPTFFKKDCFI